MKSLNKIAIGLALAFPLAAAAQSTTELQREVDQLKSQVQELKRNRGGGSAGQDSVDAGEFNAISAKVEGLIDDKETAGFRGLRISGGIDPTWLYIASKKEGSFLLGEPMGSSAFGQDNSWFGLGYLDIVKEMDGGTKFRMTLAPNKNATSFSTPANIVHEASASIPLTDAQTRLVVGQIPDVSGYEVYFNTYAGQNSITNNQLYPQYPLYFISHNLLFDFTEANFYTGIGFDYSTSAWEGRVFLANFNAQRNNLNCSSTPDTAEVTGTDGKTYTVNTSTSTSVCAKNTHPALVYNYMYYKNEFWGFEFTGYEGNVTNWASAVNSLAPAYSRLDQFEIDGNFTRADINLNWQFTVGQQKNAAFATDEAGVPLDAKWWGLSGLVSQKMGRWVFASRLDYLNNQKNGGGTFAAGYSGSLADGNTLGGASYLGDPYGGFGPGDPTAPGYDPKKGANRSALSLAATYRVSRNVAFRGEVRGDWASRPVFYYFGDQTFKKNNSMAGLQTIVNF